MQSNDKSVESTENATAATNQQSKSTNAKVHQLLVENTELKRSIEKHQRKQLEQRRTILKLRRENIQLKKKITLRKTKLNVR